MKIRHACHDDLDTIMSVYQHAKKVMEQSGNPGQWVNGYPSRELIEGDLRKERLFVLENDGQVEAVFVYFIGDEPNYHKIEGRWLNDAPYGVVHRVATAGNVRGAGQFCLDWSYEQCHNLRIDTHDDNRIMQHILEKTGYVKCGRIYVEDGSPRIAYHKTTL